MSKLSKGNGLYWIDILKTFETEVCIENSNFNSIFVLNIDLFLKSTLQDIVLWGSILFCSMFQWNIALLCVKDMVHHILVNCTSDISQ